MELHVEKLKAIRKQKKISADELAAKAGISRVTLSAWENARRIPSEAKIRMLATVLDIPVSEISDLEPDKTISKINLTPLGTNVGSILNGEKEKDINRQKNLVSGLMGILKELSNAKLIIGAMISSLPSIFYIKGSDLKYMTASEAFLKNLSLNKNFDVVGKTDYDFFPENEARINAEMDKYVIASGNSVLDKEDFIPGTRKTRWSIFSKIPIYDSEGNIEGLLGFFKDITMRKQAEEALKQSNQRLEFAHRVSGAGYWDWDITGQHLNWSKELFILFGLNPDKDKASFDTWKKVVHPDDYENAYNLLEQSIKEKKFLANEYRIIYPGGKVHWISALGDIFYSHSGQPLRMSGICTDITGRKLAEEALKRSNERMELALQAAGAAHWDWDMTCQRLDWSRELYILFGLDPDKNKASFDTWKKIIHPDDYENSHRRIQRSIKEKTPHSNEYRIIRPDGQLRWISSSGRVTYSLSGQPLRMTGISIDITARKLAENALIRREEEYRTLAENAPDLIARFDKQLRHIYVNAAAAAAGSRRPEEYIGRTMADLGIPESVRSIWDERIQEVFDSGKLIDVIDSFPFADGLHYFHTRIVPEQDNDGSVQSVVTFARDITERKQTEDKLYSALQQLKFHTENTPLAVVAFNAEYQITQWSNKAEEVFGWKADEVLGKRIQELRWVYEEDRKKVASLSTNMIKGNKTSNVNINRNYRKDGSVITCEWYNSALTDSNGRLISVYSLINDVSGRVQAEEALRESELFFKESQQAAFIGSYKLDFASGCWESSEVLDQILGIDKNYSRSIQGWLDIVHPDDRKKIDILFKEDVLTKHHPFNKEYRIIRKTDGKIRWVNDMGKIIFDNEGNAVSMIGTVQDITERKQPEKNVKMKTPKKSMPK